jgi:hypothetical protein
MLRFPAAIRLSEAMEHSYKDFHCRGLHYVCLGRSPRRTLKLYLFDGDVADLPQIVLPHDHRYHFETFVMFGAYINAWFHEQPYEAPGYTRMNRFKWDTVLKGGGGFSYDGETWLKQSYVQRFQAGTNCVMRPEEIHTIRILYGETALLLEQEHAVVTKPTRAYGGDKEPPSLDGLYGKFTADEIIALLRRFRDSTGTQFKLVK